MRKIEAKELKQGQRFKFEEIGATWKVDTVGKRWLYITSNTDRSRWIQRNDRIVWLIEEGK
jgi:hypothetical protein